MKRLQRRPFAVTTIAALVATAGCSDSNRAPTMPGPAGLVVTSIALNGNVSLTRTGETSQLTATATYQDGTTRNVTSLVSWHSDDRSVVTVSPTGMLEAVAPGFAHVWIPFGASSPTVTVTVGSSAFPVNIAGTYSMTLTASARCTGLPDVVSTRTYDATISQPQGSSLATVRVTHPDFFSTNFDAAVDGKTVWINIHDFESGDSACFYEDWWERVAPAGAFFVCGKGQLGFAESTISGPFGGTLIYDPSGTFESAATKECDAPDHHITFRPTIETPAAKYSLKLGRMP